MNRHPRIVGKVKKAYNTWWVQLLIQAASAIVKGFYWVSCRILGRFTSGRKKYRMDWRKWK
ncbi:hypothetical protein [Methanolobus chelungpuianus]|uniref:Uncharacterized protein n=1 Tax=Methanolobus chelungpuianus TaxID=502115 RepID=A0AAE3HA72_9EURY|nr:hypothetical protein [Methanolobus chelungpuianus]MCQ6962790.1 hypothetical protein [Methanolobus chelungpuianus]